MSPAPTRLAALAVAASLSSVTTATAQEFTTDRVSSKGTGVYYEVHGALSQGETPILLLHGGMGSIRTDFVDLLPALASNRTVIGIDQQGHGRTAGRDAPITLASMRADTLAVLDALNVEKVHVVGFSMGGMLAIDLGVHAPARVETLTALSVTQNVEGMHPEIVRMNRDPAYQPSAEIAALLPDEEDFTAMQAAFAENPSGPEQFSRTFETLNAFINSGWGWSNETLATMDRPALLIVGDRDFMPVSHTAAMAKLMPHAQFAVLPDTTHLTITRRAGWLASMIDERIATASE